MEHLRTLKVANLALAVFAFLGVLFGLVFVLVGIFGDVEGGPHGNAAFVLWGSICAIGFGGLSVAHVYDGFMITAGRARPLQTSLAMLHIANFPLGTVYALYALWCCWMDPKTTAIFDSPSGRRVR